MPRAVVRGCWPVVLLLIVGCTAAPSQKGPAAGDEGQLKEAFAAYQQALKQWIKDKDADKIWDLLSAEARGDADRAAKRLRDDYARADAAEKPKLAKALDLSGDEVANLTGKGFVKTPRFIGMTGIELPGSTYESATIQGNKATVKYKEADGDIEKLSFVWEDGSWKASPTVE